MSNQGTLHFNATFDGSAVKKGIQDTKQSIQRGAQDTARSIKAAQEEMTRATRENVEIQKRVVREMELEYERLKVKAKTTPTGSGKLILEQKARELKNELDLEKLALRELNEEIKQSEQAKTSLRTQIKLLKDEMASLIASGIDESSEAYRELTERLGYLQDIQGDIAAQGKHLANDEAQYAGILAGLQGVAGGFGAVTGAMSLFGGESQELQASMQKLMATMQTVQGVQAVAQALNKDSAFQLVTLVKLKEWWAGVNTRVTASLTAQTAGVAGLSSAKLRLIAVLRSLWATMLANPITAIIAGVSALALAVYKLSEAGREAERRQALLNERIIELSAEPVGAIMALSAEYRALGDNLQDKERFIQSNADKFRALGIEVHNVKDADNAFIRQTEAFKQAMIDRARATAYAEVATERYKEAAKKEAQAMQLRDTVSWSIGGSTVAGGAGASTLTMGNSEKKRLLAEANELNQEANSLIEKSVSTREKEQRILDQANKESLKALSGTIGGARSALEQRIADNKETYARLATTDRAGRERLLAERKALQAELDALDGDKGGGKGTASASAKPSDPYKEMLEQRKAQYETYYKMVNSADQATAEFARKHFAELLRNGETYLDYLKRQREELTAEGGRGNEQKLVQLNTRIAEESERTLSEDFKQSLDKALASADDALDRLLIIQRKREELQSDSTTAEAVKRRMAETLADSERSALSDLERAQQEAQRKHQEYLDSRLSDYQRYIAERERLLALMSSDNPDERQGAEYRLRTLDTEQMTRREQELDKLREQYKTFEQSIADIARDFEEKRATARLSGNAELLRALDRAERAALSSQAMQELQSNPLYERLFGNLDEIATSELEKLLELFADSKAVLGIELSPQDLEALKDKLRSVKSELEERNPFKALARSIGEYSRATDQAQRRDAISAMARSAGSSLELVGGAVDSVRQGLEAMGIDMEGTLGTTLSSIQSLVGSGAKLATGIASGNPLAMLEGGIGLLTTAFDMFGNSDKQAEKRIKAHKAEVNRLGIAYQELERSVQNALGSERYDKADDQIRNLAAQQRHLRMMANEERSKKKKDQSAIDNYYSQVREIEQRKEELVRNLRNDLMTTDVAGAARSLGEAFIEAFAKGQNAAGAFAKRVDELVAGIVRNMLIKQLFEKPIGSILDKYSARWVDKAGNFAGFGAIERDVDSLSRELKGVTDGIMTSGKSLLDKLSSFTPLSGEAGTLTAEVKGVTESTARLLEAQINAIRIVSEAGQTARMTMSEQLRTLTGMLSAIKSDTAYLQHLESIDRQIAELGKAPKASSLDSPSSIDSELRAKGIN